MDTDKAVVSASPGYPGPRLDLADTDEVASGAVEGNDV